MGKGAGTPRFGRPVPNRDLTGQTDPLLHQPHPYQFRRIHSTIESHSQNYLRIILMKRIAWAIWGFLAAAAPLAAQDTATLARRVAATATLAVQEYRLGVADGQIVLAPEVEEAVLFLEEARRAAGQLPVGAREPLVAGLDGALALVTAVASPDSVAGLVGDLLEQLTAELGVPLDEIPDQPPLLAHGAEIYRRECAACHGLTGRGDGPAAPALDPAPADLTDFDGLRDASPLDFFRRISIGTPGTAMPGYDGVLPAAERWAVALYASTLRLPAAAGEVPRPLRSFAMTARLSDDDLLAEFGAGGTLALVAAVRHLPPASPVERAAAVFETVRYRLDSAYALAAGRRHEEARQAALDAYLTFEQVEREIRARRPALATRLETAFADLRGAVVSATDAGELPAIQARLAAGLEEAQRLVGDGSSAGQLFMQSFIILVREGLEAILILGALLAFLTRAGATHRRRDVIRGAVAAVVASLLTAVLIETVFRLSPAHRERLEGFTMLVAAATLFYVSYWLLSKVEATRWTGYLRGQLQYALASGSALALVAVAFLAVYREGFETVLFYKALWVSAGGVAATIPILGGMALASVVLIAVYIAVNRFGVRLPLRPLFAATGGFLYYMAFVFAGKGVAELQEGGMIGTTVVPWAPRLPALGIYPTVETLLAQGVLAALAVAALGYLFLIAPRRRPAADTAGTDDSTEATAHSGVVEALERLEAELAGVRAELERIKARAAVGSSR